LTKFFLKAPDRVATTLRSDRHHRQLIGKCLTLKTRVGYEIGLDLRKRVAQ
jgi:hypothetical protein